RRGGGLIGTGPGWASRQTLPALAWVLALGDDRLERHDNPVGDAALVLGGGALDRLVEARRNRRCQPMIARLLALGHSGSVGQRLSDRQPYRPPVLYVGCSCNRRTI